MSRYVLSATTLVRGSAGMGVMLASNPNGQRVILCDPLACASRSTRCGAVPDDRPILPASTSE